MKETRKPHILRFEKLRNGSKFRIFSEPSRGIPHEFVKDKRTYVKVSDSSSALLTDQSESIILYPQDLVEVIK